MEHRDVALLRVVQILFLTRSGPNSTQSRGRLRPLALTWSHNASAMLGRRIADHPDQIDLPIGGDLAEDAGEILPRAALGNSETVRSVISSTCWCIGAPSSRV